MSKSNNLTHFLKDVADAIRVKKGVSGNIDPQNFSEEIKSIKSDPELEPLSRRYTANKTEMIEPPVGKDGFSSVTIEVDVPTSGSTDYKIQSKNVTVTENNKETEIKPDSDYHYMDVVNVTTAIPMQEKSVTYNDNVSGAVIEADSGYGGLSKVTVNVDVPNQGSDVSIEPVRDVDITENNHTRVISPAVGYDALAGVNVIVNIPLQDKEVEITESGETTILKDDTYEGLNSVKVTPILEDKTTTITANNTYYIKASEGNCGIGEHKIIVSVPTGGGGTTPITPVEPKDVNFYDYDGTLLYSYTKTEVQGLTALPAPPSVPEGLGLEDTVEWNYTLAQIKHMGVCEVGSIYTKNSGLVLVFDVPYDGFYLWLVVRCSTGDATVDWGDGSNISTVAGQGNIGHPYTTAGRYIIKYDALNSNAVITVGTTNVNVCKDISTSSANGFAYSSLLVGAVLGNNCKLYQHAFYYCGLNFCIISKGISTVIIPSYAFNYCYQLKHITFPCKFGLSSNSLSFSGLRHLSLTMDGGDAIESDGSNVFANCFNLRRMVLPPVASTATLPLNNLSNTNSLRQLVIKKGRSFTGILTLKSLAVLDLTDYETVPTLASTLTLPTACKILVKAGLLSDFKSASNWSPHSSKFVAV